MVPPVLQTSDYGYSWDCNGIVMACNVNIWDVNDYSVQMILEDMMCPKMGIYTWMYHDVPLFQAIPLRKIRC